MRFLGTKGGIDFLTVFGFDIGFINRKISILHWQFSFLLGLGV